MKINLAKYAFGVSSGKFLGFMVSQRGIEANPEKVNAVLGMQSPQTTKHLQQLTGRIAALNRFISRSTDKCFPFFKILRKAFEWNSECEEAFGKLKEYLINPPLLSRPDEGEILYLYLTGNITLGRKLDFGSRGFWGPKIGVFHQQSTSWSRGEVPPDRKVSIRLDCLGTKTQAILSSTCHMGTDRVSNEKNIAKTGPLGQAGELVGRTRQFDIEFHLEHPSRVRH
jgi:hypothetical protein